jgi:hypothetical protein
VAIIICLAAIFIIPFTFEADTVSLSKAIVILMVCTLTASASFLTYIISERREEKHAEERELNRRRCK